MVGKTEQVRILKQVRRNLVRERNRTDEHTDNRKAMNDLAGENHFRGIVIGIENSIREPDTALANLCG